jgi:hypothetical protein
MTITPEAPTQSQDLQVRTDPAGTPLAIRHAAARGSGDLVSVEYWRVQAQVPGSNSPLRTFTLRRQPLATQWLLESIDDGD